MRKYFFKNKTFGWGWTPASWECPTKFFSSVKKFLLDDFCGAKISWVITLVYLIGMVVTFRKIDLHSHSGSDTLIGFSLPFIVFTLMFLFVCYKTGEKPEWRWGKKNKNSQS